MPTVNDGKIYTSGGFPPTAGNDPTRVCRDFEVPLPRGGVGDLPTNQVAVKAFLREALKRDPKVEYCSQPWMLEIPYLEPTSLLFQTVHECFAEHLPLALSPDLLMYLVLHEVSICVKQNPQDYAGLFTSRTDGQKQLIHVRHDGLILGNPKSPWNEALGLFHAGLTDRVPSDVMKHALPSFSTHTVETQAASLVAFMDAASPYYDYRVMTKCGIPTIRLLGTPEDYVKLYESCLALSGLFAKHLKTYFSYLLPVLAVIKEQAAGSPQDDAFWSSIYKPLHASGTDDMTGWLSAFLNYTSSNGKVQEKPQHCYDWAKPQGGWPRGFPRGEIPCHLNVVNFIWEYLGTEYPMEFIGGVLTRGNLDGFVTPHLGYAVIHKG